MALVLGPTRPPTLAVLAWQWLLDADVAMNRQGAAAALVLAGVMAVVAAVVVLAWRASRTWRATRWTRGDRPPLSPSPPGGGPGWGRALQILYATIIATLAFISLAGVWTFPHLLPQQWTPDAW